MLLKAGLVTNTTMQDALMNQGWNRGLGSESKQTLISL